MFFAAVSRRNVAHRPVVQPWARAEEPVRVRQADELPLGLHLWRGPKTDGQEVHEAGHGK